MVHGSGSRSKHCDHNLNMPSVSYFASHSFSASLEQCDMQYFAHETETVTSVR